MSTTTTAPAKVARPGGFDVPRGGGKCMVCGRVIEAGEKYFAAIRETPLGIERNDIAPECWEGFDKAGILAFWQTVMPKAGEKKKVFVDDEVLCSLFERLADATEPAKVSFRFVLGLILMRKRLVIYDATRHDEGRDVWVVRMKGKPEQLDLVDPKLDEQQMAEVSGQLGQILNEEI
jgi:hypothetical protein